MCKGNKPYPWWGFWRIFYLPVVIHSTLLFISIIDSISAFEIEFNRNPNSVSSFIDSMAIFLSRYERLWPLVLVLGPLGIIGFMIARHHHKWNHFLTTYAVIQCLVGLIPTAALLYLIHRGFIITWQSANGMSRTWIGYDWTDFSAWIMLYSCISIPVIFLIGRGMYMMAFGSSPQIDASGRYLVCISCGYDLRGTPGSACSECGASVMAVEKPVSN
jgi:hypothetical protein